MEWVIMSDQKEKILLSIRGFFSMIFKKVKRQLIKIYEGLTLKAEKPLGYWAKNKNKNGARNNARINVS